MRSSFSGEQPPNKKARTGAPKEKAAESPAAILFRKEKTRWQASLRALKRAVDSISDKMDEWKKKAGRITACGYPKEMAQFSLGKNQEVHDTVAEKYKYYQSLANKYKSVHDEAQMSTLSLEIAYAAADVNRLLVQFDGEI